MDEERCKSKSQMVSIKACCQDAAWASFSLRVGELGTEEEPRAGQDRALPARAQSSCAQARRARDTQMSWSGSASILFLALWTIFIIPYIEMRNIAFLMFLSHKYNCYSHHKHTICPGRRVNDPCNNQVDHCHFLKVRKKRKFKTMEKQGNPQCCYFLLLYFLLLLLNDMQKV